MSSRELSLCTEQTMEALALNGEQARRLYDPSPEVDSLAERIIALAAHGVPATVLRELTDEVLAVLRLNASERGEQLAVCGALDTLSRVYREREREITARVQDDLTIRGLVRRLRPDLAIIAAGPGTRGYTAAVLALGDTVRQTSHDRLTAPSLRHELGQGRWDLLQEYVRQATTT